MKTRRWTVLAVLAAATTAAACASTSFRTTWKAPDAAPLSFKGKKVAALIVSKDESVRLGGEDALAKEITDRGAIGLPAYGLIPKELLQDKEKAKEFLEKANVVGVVAMRVVGTDQKITEAPGNYWGTPYYSSFWGSGYYAWGWSGVYDTGHVTIDKIVMVETLVYSLEQNKLVWAGQSSTTNPSNVRPFIQELAAKAAAELKKQGLVR